MDWEMQPVSHKTNRPAKLVVPRRRFSHSLYALISLLAFGFIAFHFVSSFISSSPEKRSSACAIRMTIATETATPAVTAALVT